MVRKAFVISAILITIIVIVSIIISVMNLKPFEPLEFKTVVSYDKDTYAIVDAPKYEARSSGDSLTSLTNLLKYEKTIMVSTIILVIIFMILFYGTKGSKGW